MTFMHETRPSTGHPLHALANALATRARNWQRRRAYQTLRDLDDAILNDIGVTRAEVEAANALPVSVNAATELRRVSLERRRHKL